jgi:hypothetical protein
MAMTKNIDGSKVRVSVRQGKNAWDDRCAIGRKAGGVQRHGSSCRKSFPFVFQVEGLDVDGASQIFLTWVKEAEAAGADKIGDGSFDASYDRDTKTFEVLVSYPKDFDADLDGQRAEVQHKLRMAAKAAKSSALA